MNLHEMKYLTALEIGKQVFQKFPEAIFCGGTALNTFYLDYRYSEDIDIGYENSNPKSDIEVFLRSRGYLVNRTNFKPRDIVIANGTEIKMDIFEYTPIKNTIKKEIDGIAIRTLSEEEFVLSKTISFITREEKNGIIRDAYDLYKLNEITDALDFIKSHRTKVLDRVSVVRHNFDLFYNYGNINSAIEPLLKTRVEPEKVKKFIRKIEGELI